MAHFVGDPLLRRRDAEGARSVLVPPESAIQRNKPIAEHPVGEKAAPLRERRRYGIALNIPRQRNEQIAFIRDRAVAQGLDTGASRFAQLSKRRRVRAQIQDHVEPMPAAFQRHAAVRRSKKHHVPKKLPPTVVRPLGEEAGAARDESSHAVADEGDFLQGNRPIRRERFEQGCKLQTVRCDGEAAVVVEIKRKVSQFLCQRRAVIMAVAVPLQIVRAQAVHEQHKLG